MKLELFNLDNITIYLNKDYLNKINFNLEENVEKEFRKLFLKIKNIYNINMRGYYEVIVYVNNNYGIIIELEKDDDDYVKIFGDTLDMKIVFKFDSDIYYKLEEFENYNFEDYHLYYDNNNFYIKLNKNDNINYSEYLKLIENSTIIYGTSLNDIKNNLIKLK